MIPNSHERPFQARRSFIFSPGFKPEMFPKALVSGADMVCIDLEDAIAPMHKDVSRERTLALFEEPQADDGVERIVRINCVRTKDGLKDLLAISEAKHAPPALMLPKIKGPDEVALVDALLSEARHQTRLHVIIETNEGLEAVQEIAVASDRIDGLFFGGVDMAADLRVGGSHQALLYARCRLVHAAATAGLDVIDVPFLDLEDPEGMRREAETARELGFTGKGSIHPKQIPVINGLFSPSEADIAHARKIVEAFEKGDSGLVVVDGKLIEKPVLRSMYAVLSLAENMKKRG